MTEDLISFLRARLDEDEAVARHAFEYASPDWHLDDETGETVLWWPSEPRIAEKEREKGLPVVSDRWRGQTMEAGGARIAPHIARHDPARVLREVTAKRSAMAELLDEGHAALRPGGYTEVYCPADYGTGEPCDCGRDERASRYLRLLALPYADHPDYRQEWRP